MTKAKDRVEFRLIGSIDQLERAAEFIASAYDIYYQSKLYPCKENRSQRRQYYQVTEKEQDRKKEESN